MGGDIKILLIFLFSINLYSNPCKTIFKKLYSTNPPLYSKDFAQVKQDLLIKKHLGTLKDSSAELEFKLHKKVMSILNTTDGTLKPLFINENQLKHAPRWLNELKSLCKLESITSIKWNTLTDEDKILLLKHLTKFRNIKYKDDRKINGLIVKKNLKLNFNSDTFFLGNYYKKGIYSLNLSRYFPEIHIMIADDETVLTGIELQFRTNETAGQTTIDAWSFMEAAGLERIHQHNHIVFPLPDLNSNTENSFLKTLELLEYFRRINLVAEMRDIINYNVTISSKIINGDIYFKHLSISKLKQLFSYLEFLRLGIVTEIKDFFKQAWIGFRGIDKYDEPNILGFEVRPIGDEDDPKEVEEFLDTIQHAALNYNFHKESITLNNWISQNKSNKSSSDLVSLLWYDRSIKSLVENLHPKLKESINRNLIERIKKSIKIDKTLKKGFRYWLIKHIQVKMLLYNWSNDPLVYSNMELKRSVLYYQMKAFNDIINGSSPLHATIEFLRKSGIYEEFSKSISEIILP